MCRGHREATRLGCDMLLVDRYGFLGGMLTSGNMTVLNCPIGRKLCISVAPQRARTGVDNQFMLAMEGMTS
jgi:hypothetical protein